MKYFLRVFLLILLVGAVAYNSAITETTTTIIDKFRDAFALPILTIRNFFSVNDFAKNLSSLALENQSLRAELWMAKISAPEPSGKLIRAKVHASYPFNNKSALTLARGSQDGIKKDMAVLASPGIYLGTVSYVEKNWSEVRTVFDSEYQTPVRISERGVAALLRGGANLSASMIDKTKILKVGEAVYLAQKGLPYGLKIGEIRNLREGSGGVFQEADILPPYTINDLEEVFIYAP
jgi:cell shape-determining protein MreC